MLISTPIKFRGLDIERFLPNLRDYVRNGGGLAMVGGEQSFGDGRYGSTPLADVLPVAPIDGSTMFEGEVRPRLTPEGRRHPLASLAPGDAQNEATWAALPAAERAAIIARANSVKPGLITAIPTCSTNIADSKSGRTILTQTSTG